jgi:hypothetical protein
MVKYLRVILTLIISVLTLATIFSQLEGEEFEYIWEPSKSGNKVRLPLLEPEPDFFGLEFPCNLVRSEPNWIVDSQGASALQIQLFPDKINVVLENKDFETKNFTIPRKTLSGINCVESLSFNRDRRKIEYLSNDESKSISIGKEFQFPIRSWMQWNDQIDYKSVKITIITNPGLYIANSKLKNVLNFIWVIVAISMIVISVKRIKWKNFKIYRSETASLISVLVLGVIGVPKYDDGWYLLTATALNNDNVYTNFAYPVAPPNGFLHAKLLSLFTNENPIILFTRIPGMVSAFVIWIIINRIFIPWMSSQSNHKIPVHIYWSSWLAFTTGFYITLRPEPLIALFLTVIVGLALLGSRVSLVFSNLLILTTMGLAIAVHQSGTTVLASGFALLLINNYKAILTRKVEYYGLIWGLNVFLFSIFWNTSPRKILSGLKSYNELDSVYPGSTSITSSPLNEYERILAVFKPGIIPNIQVWVILMLFFTVAWFTVYNLRNKSGNFSSLNLKLFIVITSAFLGLFLATSKWASYYGVFIASYILILSFIISKNTGNQNKILLISSFIIFYYSFGRSWKSIIFEVPMRSPYSISVEKLFTDSRSTFLIATILAITLALFALKTKVHTLTFLNIAIILAYIFNPVLDSLNSDSGWTFIRQSVEGMQNNTLVCGIADDTKMNENGYESIQDFVIKNSASATLTPGNFYYSPCLTPISTQEGRWEMPDISIGLQIYDQQRLLLNTEQVELGCNSILLENNRLPKEDFCFYRVYSSIPDLDLSKKRKYLY